MWLRLEEQTKRSTQRYNIHYDTRLSFKAIAMTKRTVQTLLRYCCTTQRSWGKSAKDLVKNIPTLSDMFIKKLCEPDHQLMNHFKARFTSSLCPSFGLDNVRFGSLLLARIRLQIGKTVRIKKAAILNSLIRITPPPPGTQQGSSNFVERTHTLLGCVWPFGWGYVPACSKVVSGGRGAA